LRAQRNLGLAAFGPN